MTNFIQFSIRRCHYHTNRQQFCIIIMYSSTPRAEGSQRDRPLQKSMFLPEHPSQGPFVQQRVQPLMQQTSYNPLKRSSMPVLENLNGTISPSYHFNQNHISFNPSNSTQIININPLYQNESRAQSSHQFLVPNQLNIKHQNANLQNEGEMRNFVKFEKQMAKDVQPNSNSFHETKDQIPLVIQIVEQIKEKYLINWLSPLKKELLDEINNLKSQFQEIKSEIKQKKDQQGTQTKQLRAQLTKMIENKYLAFEKQTKEQTKFQKQVNLLEERVSQLQNKFGSNFNQLLSEISKISSRFQKESKQKSVKSSLIKSSLPSFLLQYKQSFTLHKSNQLLPKTQDEEIVFTSRQYYIDKKGYLMDSQNRYLVDHQGIQIRLQDKHLRILEHHKILQK